MEYNKGRSSPKIVKLRYHGRNLANYGNVKPNKMQTKAAPFGHGVSIWSQEDGEYETSIDSECTTFLRIVMSGRSFCRGVC